MCYQAKMTLVSIPLRTKSLKRIIIKTFKGFLHPNLFSKPQIVLRLFDLFPMNRSVRMPKQTGASLFVSLSEQRHRQNLGAEFDLYVAF